MPATKTATSRRPSSSKGAGTPRGQGVYAHRACDVCRTRKLKCDERKPICGTCEVSNRITECSWSGKRIRGARTEANFEAMRKYTEILEALLDTCWREHGGASNADQSYLQFRPVCASGDSFEDMEDEDHVVDEDDGTLEICVQTEGLKLETCGSLVRYGPLAPFRHITPDDSRRSDDASRFPAEITQNPDSTYVLLVDGADESHCNPDFEWFRYLPSTVPLDRQEHDKLLGLLFSFFTSWCLRIVPALFLRDMYRVLSVSRYEKPPRTSHYSPMLHNALMAVATAFSDDPRIRDCKSRLCYAAEAKKLIEEECNQPNICVVHALSILASFHSSKGDQTLGYMYFGMSARISQSLGLNIDSSVWVDSGRISRDDMLDRNWAYWTTFCQDVCWSLYVGREFGVPLPSGEHKIPVPFVDASYDQIPWHYPPSNIPPQPNNLSMTFAAYCELLVIARRVHDVVNALNTPMKRPEGNDVLISRIDLQLYNWKACLAPEVQITPSNRATSTPHRLMTHLAYWWTFILLHRPFFHPRMRLVTSTMEIDHRKLCKTAADNIMELLDTWRSLYTLRYVPMTLVQVTFAAGTVCLLLSTQAASGLRVAKETLDTYQFRTELCIQYLNEIGRSWQCATNIAEILKNLLQTRLKPILEKRCVTSGSAFSFPAPSSASTSASISGAPSAKTPASPLASRAPITPPPDAHSSLPPNPGANVNLNPVPADDLAGTDFDFGLATYPSISDAEHPHGFPIWEAPVMPCFGATGPSGVFDMDISFDAQTELEQAQGYSATSGLDYSTIEKLWNQQFM